MNRHLARLLKSIVIDLIIGGVGVWLVTADIDKYFYTGAACGMIVSDVYNCLLAILEERRAA